MAQHTVTTSPEPPQSQGKAQRAYEWIAGEIRARRFAPGHRLVLTQLADAIGVSVAPVREALRLLEAEGLVTNQRNIGATVAMIDERGYAEVMHTLAVLEGCAVSLAAPHLTADDLTRARAINDQMATLVESVESFDPQQFTHLNHEFHEALYLKCPNTYLCDLVGASWNRLDSLRESSFTFIPRRAHTSVEEHRGILEAIESGADPTEIERLARAHRLATLGAFRDRPTS